MGREGKEGRDGIEQKGEEGGKRERREHYYPHTAIGAAVSINVNKRTETLEDRTKNEIKRTSTKLEEARHKRHGYL